MPKHDREFESFMERVNKIGSIIQRLNSADKSVSEEASREAELCVEGKTVGKINEGACVIKHDRTVINKSAFDADTLDQPSSSKEAFMSMVSRDADERAKAKREREYSAKKLMKDAEKFMLAKDYESALYSYTKAIDEQVNWPRLFIERAKVLLDLRLLKRADEDCEKALKINEDLLFLKGESATAEDKENAQLLAAEVKLIKEHILKVAESE